MSLKAFTFTLFPTSSSIPPKVRRRQNLIARLEEQLNLAKDSSYAPTRLVWRKDADGQPRQESLPRRIRPWWKLDAAGSLVLSVRVGLRRLEFEKGRSGIVVGPQSRLQGVISDLIAVAKAGELDALLEASVPPKNALGRRPRAPNLTEET